MAILNNLGVYKDFGLLVMRIGVGAMMVVHGYPKVLGGPDYWEKVGVNMRNIGVDFLPVFWGAMAAGTEAFGGLLLILGYFFRPTCLLLVFTMIVAAISHFSRGQGVNEASHAIALGFAFFGLMFIGPGKHALEKG
ncbi:MAG TPA: DoxX family protein [Cytophagales bacterium]|nr:DoxX family protein [Cytophagales bacterium]